MAELINLRRARKAKKRADEKAKSAAPGVKKPARVQAKAENAKIAHDLDARKLDKP